MWNESATCCSASETVSSPLELAWRPKTRGLWSRWRCAWRACWPRRTPAYRERNLDRAVAVLRSDAEMDRLRNLIFLHHLEGQREQSGAESFHVLFMAQGLERAGDHAKNIVEEVCHLVSGRTVRHVLRSYDIPDEKLFIERLRTQHREK